MKNQIKTAIGDNLEKLHHADGAQQQRRTEIISHICQLFHPYQVQPDPVHIAILLTMTMTMAMTMTIPIKCRQA